MIKLLFLISLILIICSGCNKDPSSIPVDDVADDRGSTEILKQVDSLFNILDVKPPDNWEIRQVKYRSEYGDDTKWEEKKIESIIYFSGTGDIFYSVNGYDYSKLLPGGDLKYVNYLGGSNHITKNLGVPLAIYDLQYMKGTASIEFGHDCVFFEYSSAMKIAEIFYSVNMTEEKRSRVKYYYEDSQLKKKISDGSTTYFHYGNNGMINMVTHENNSYTTLYQQNADGFLISTIEQIGNNRSDTSRLTYSSRKIIFEYSDSYQSRTIQSYQDQDYKTLLSVEQDNQITSKYEYGSNFIRHRRMNHSEYDLNSITDYRFNNSNHLTELIEYGANGVPEYKYIFEYYEK